MNAHPHFFDPAHHPSALASLATEALSRGDHRAAFMCADRRCRIKPLAEAAHFTLRSEASYRLGDAKFALSDIRQALEISPEDLPALQRLFSWGTPAERAHAARVLIERETRWEILRAAVEEEL